LGICGKLVFFFCALICIFALPSGAQDRPYGLGERVPNTSLLIDLEAGAPPATISASGLFSDTAKKIVAPGIIPYSVNSELWSDGAYKTRFFALPGIAQIDFSKEGPWQFPPNSVLVKNFYLEFVKGDPTSRQIIETRFLVKDGQSDNWKGFSYQWNDDATDATLLRESAYLTFFIADAEAPDGFAQQRYFYPGPEDCSLCHREAAGRILGPRTGQLNGELNYGGTTDNQLRTLNHIGLFSEDIGEEYNTFPQWANPRDESAPIETRARAYLAANCSHCHRPGGVDRAFFDLRYDTPLEHTRTIDISPTLGRLDAEPENVRIINPGNANNSTLLLRTLNFSSFRMPPVASSVLDEQGTQLLRRWIDGMSPPTDIKTEAAQPQQFALAQNYPNPFNPSTTIEYHIEASGPAELAIFDILGQQVRTLVRGEREPGRYAIQWDGRSDDGISAASGVYFYRLSSVAGERTRRLLLLR
jgi:uncharacterized repeat protein (TIGR03806 family)